MSTPSATHFARRGAATALLLAAAACGRSSTAPQAQSPGSGPAPLTAAKAQTLAESAILTARDLPGTTASPITRSAGAATADEKLQECLGLAPVSYLTRNPGTSFSQRDLEIESSADVYATAEAARSEFAALKERDGERCLNKTISTSLTIFGAALRSASLTPVRIDVPASDASFCYRLSVTTTVQGKTGSITGYELGSLVGQVGIQLGALTFGDQPVDLDRAVQLLSTATARVHSAS